MLAFVQSSQHLQCRLLGTKRIMRKNFNHKVKTYTRIFYLTRLNKLWGSSLFKDFPPSMCKLMKLCEIIIRNQGNKPCEILLKWVVVYMWPHKVCDNSTELTRKKDVFSTVFSSSHICWFFKKYHNLIKRILECIL